MLIPPESIIPEALHRYGLTGSSFRVLKRNNSLAVDVSDKYVLKLSSTDQKTGQLLNNELRWIKFLSEQGVNAPIIIRSDNQQLYEFIEQNNHSYWAVLYEKGIGSALAIRDWDAPLFELWGELMGRLHSKSKLFPNKTDDYRGQDWHYDFLNPSDYLPRSKRHLSDLYAINKKELLQIPQSEHNYGLIHYDVNPTNFLVDGRSLYLFDFDDCHFDWFCADLASAAFIVIDTPGLYRSRSLRPPRGEMSKKFLYAFLKGYSHENSVENLMLEHLDLFLRRRIMNLIIDHYKKGRPMNRAVINFEDTLLEGGELIDVTGY